jgi:hypothetical protein
MVRRDGAGKASYVKDVDAFSGDSWNEARCKTQARSLGLLSTLALSSPALRLGRRDKNGGRMKLWCCAARDPGVLNPPRTFLFESYLSHGRHLQMMGHLSLQLPLNATGAGGRESLVFVKGLLFPLI